MRRTNIYLSDRQQKVLGRMAVKLGISTAELIRRILDEYIDRETPAARSN